MKNNETNPVHEFLRNTLLVGYDLGSEQALETMNTGGPPSEEFLNRKKQEFDDKLEQIISEYQEYENRKKHQDSTEQTVGAHGCTETQPDDTGKEGDGTGSEA